MEGRFDFSTENWGGIYFLGGFSIITSIPPVFLKHLFGDCLHALVGAAVLVINRVQMGSAEEEERPLFEEIRRVWRGKVIFNEF